MKSFDNLTLPKSMMTIETREKSLCNIDLKQPPLPTANVSVSSNVRITEFVSALLATDLSHNPYVKEIKLSPSDKRIIFYLHKPIVPCMAIKSRRKYIFDAATMEKLKAADSSLEIHSFAMKIPDNYTDRLKIRAQDANGNPSTHPNSNDDRMCYGTYENRVFIGTVQISKLYDLMQIANLDSAYREFRAEVNWDEIPSEDY